MTFYLTEFSCKKCRQDNWSIMGGGGGGGGGINSKSVIDPFT